MVFSKDKADVLLCRRQGEADYDSIFSFIEGKLETTDRSITEGLKREKEEGVGEDFKIKVYPVFSWNTIFTKKDGSAMVLPHYLVIHDSGEVSLNEEYSEYKWIDLKDLELFEPKIPNITKVVQELSRITKISRDEEFVLL